MVVEQTEQRTFRLASAEMVNAPGLMRWAVNGYAFKRDRKVIMEVMKSWPGPTDEEWDLVLSSKVPYEVDGDVVVLNFPG